MVNGPRATQQVGVVFTMRKSRALLCLFIMYYNKASYPICKCDIVSHPKSLILLRFT
jgi:hypothetical protein